MSESSPKDLHRAVFEASPDGILIVGASGVIEDLNPKIEDLFGYARAELLGAAIEVLVPESVRGAHAGHRSSYARDPHARPMGIGLELRGRRKDGSTFPVEISLSPLPTRAGTLTIATVRDMTQRNRLRDFSTGALRASEEERQRIARELHDDTAQHLATLLVHLRLLQRSEGDAWREQLDGFRDELKAVADGVRRIARGLRPPELEDAGVVAALRSHLRLMRDALPSAVELDLDPVDPHLDPDGKLVLYRIVQEALSNAARHSDATRLRLRVALEGGDVVAEVSDDGRGFRASTMPEAGGGLGLLGMQERAVMVGGRVAIDSGPGKGTTVSLRIPVVPSARRGRDDQTAEVEHV